MQFIAKSLSSRCSYSTSFSGIDAPGTAACILTQNLMEMNRSAPLSYAPPKHLFAIEKFKPSADELRAHPSAPECVFGNVCEFFKDSVKQTINRMKSENIDWNRDTFMPLIKQGAKALTPKMTAFCSVHKRRLGLNRRQFDIVGICGCGFVLWLIVFIVCRGYS